MRASETIADADALFENGTVAMFEGAKKAEVKIEDLSGDTEYKLYAAARNLNPFLYSELVSESIDTHVAYTDMITLESVGLTSFSYHIMKPEGVTRYKHICVSKSDYDYIVNLIGSSLHAYVSAFGAEATEDQTYNFDTTFFDANDFRQDIYSDMNHSDIVELKYAKYKAPKSHVEEPRPEAIVQANRYADTDTVKRAVGTTQLHKIVVVYKGMDMPICEEV